MAGREIILACGRYDRTIPIIHNIIAQDGISPTVVQIDDNPTMFSNMFRGKYDASEMSLAELVYHRSRNTNQFLGIPVFPSRIFRHGYIFFNTKSKIRAPADLVGKRVGFPRLVQTATIWIRGMLIDECRISPSAVAWVAASKHHWKNHADTKSFHSRDGSVVQIIGGSGNDNEIMERALLDHKIDILGATRSPQAFLRGDAMIQRLFGDHKEVEASYFQKTKIFPIMHILVAQKNAVNQNAALPRQLFELFCRAKKWANEWLRTNGSLGMVWKNSYLQHERQVFGGDPWAYGFRKNFHVLERFLSYCYDLGVSERKIRPEDLFFPDTLDLIDA